MIVMNNGMSPAKRIATGIYAAQAASELSNVKNWEAEWEESKVGHDHHIFKKHPVAICGFWGVWWV